MMRIKLSLLQKIITEALENAYDVLGIQPGASRKEILAAWRRLVHDARATRGGGRGGQEGALINYYGKAVRAALAGLEGADPTFEPKVPRAPAGSSTGWDASAAAADNARIAGDMAADAGMGAGGEMGGDASFDVAGSKMARVGRKPKESYKVYKTKDGRSVVRIQGKLYGTGPAGALPSGGKTRFAPNDRANTVFDPDQDGRNVTVNKPGEDYSQTWDPIDEVRKIVDAVIIESLCRMA